MKKIKSGNQKQSIYQLQDINISNVETENTMLKVKMKVWMRIIHIKRFLEIINFYTAGVFLSL